MGNVFLEYRQLDGGCGIAQVGGSGRDLSRPEPNRLPARNTLQHGPRRNFEAATYSSDRLNEEDLIL